MYDKSPNDSGPRVLARYMNSVMLKKFEATFAAAIHENEIFERLRGIGKTIEELLADQTDYRAKIKETDDQEEKRLFARLIATKRLASGITREFGSVFKALF